MCFPFFVGLNEGKAGHTEILSFRGFDFNRAKWQHADDNAFFAECDDGLANFGSRGIHGVFFPFLFWLLGKICDFHNSKNGRRAVLGAGVVDNGFNVFQVNFATNRIAL